MRQRRGAILLILAGLLFGLLACEIGLRAIGISYPIYSQIDAVLGWSLRPGAQGFYQREGHAYVRVNSAGLRDREHVLAKPANTVRIAVLGDSYAEAVQVPMEDTFWSVLERQITTCPSFGGRQVEVINFGVSGYGTAQELLMLRDRVWRYSPDIIVLAIVTANDIRDNSRVLQQENKRPYFVSRNGELVEDFSFREPLGFRLRNTEFGKWMHQIWNSSRIFQVLVEVKRIATARSAQISDVASPSKAYAEPGLNDWVYAEPHNAAWKEAWEVTEALMELIRDEARAKGADLLVVTLSNGPQVHPDPAVRRSFAKRLDAPHLFYPDFRLRDLGKQKGFSVLNLAPPFQNYAESHQVFLHGFENSEMGTGHWNKRGHHLAGRLIAETLCPGLRKGVAVSSLR